MDTFDRLTRSEQTLGMPEAATPPRSGIPRREGSAESPVDALKAIIGPLVSGRTTYVLFSGGRDSSAVLAVATRVARELGADDPIPLIGRHNDAPDSNETEWQDLVLSHLKLTQTIVRRFTGEQSLLSSRSEESLRSTGLLWPPSLHVQAAYVDDLPLGNVLSGEGGDFVIGPRRISRTADAIRARRPRETLRAAYGALAVSRWRRTAADNLQIASPWLTPEGRTMLTDVIQRMTPEPLSWSAGLRSMSESRPARMANTNFRGVFDVAGFHCENPLEHPRFVSALSATAHYWGPGNRTQMMRSLFGNLLPDRVLSRQTKASFNDVRWTHRERDFAREWSGNGVDSRFIDHDKLRDAWLSDIPPVLSDVHLHAAWLSDNNIPSVPHVA